MNFLYDLIASQPNIDGDFHGGGKYAKKIFLELAKFNKNQVALFALYDSGKKLDKDIYTAAQDFKIKLIDVNSMPIEDIFNQFSIDRYYSALPNNTTFKFMDVFKFNCVVIGTIHGMRNLEIPYDFTSLKYSTNIKEGLRNLSKIIFHNYFKKRDYLYYQGLLDNMKVITVSNHSKYNILTFYPKVKDNIHVFYSPDVTPSYSNTSEENFNESNYFLLVSGNRWIKNNLRSAIALDQLFSERPDIESKVIITGVIDKQVYLKRINNKERFVFYEYVSEELLSTLYKNAFALIYMTLNEGFGYPPLEAMKYGVPVVASPLTSITEVCGEAVLYANPFSIDEIKNRILQLILDSKSYQILGEKGKSRYKLINSKQEDDLQQMLSYLLSPAI